MKSMWRFPFALVAASLLFGGCGGGGGGSDDGSGPGPAPPVSLKTAVQRTMSNAPVVTAILQRQESSTTNTIAIAGATVTFEKDVSMAGMTVAVPVAATTDGNGTASRALLDGTYRMSLQPGNLPPEVGTFQETFSVSGDRTLIRRTSEQQLNITAAADLQEVHVEAYLSDASGALLRDEGGDPLPPVLVMTGVPVNGRTPILTTQLFQGTYRLAVEGVPAPPANPTAPPAQLARALSQPITAQGGGKNEVIPLTLSDAGNTVTLTLLDLAGNPLAGYEVEVVDLPTLLPLGVETTDPQGVASVLIEKQFTNVVAMVFDSAGDLRGILPVKDLSPTTSAAAKTMQLRNVSGRVVPAQGSAPASAFTGAEIRATANSGLGPFFDQQLAEMAPPTPINLDGTFTMQLFGTLSGLPYRIEPKFVQGFPTVNPLTLTVAEADLTAQNLTVSPGGVFTGRLQDEARTNLQDVPVHLVGVVDGAKSVVQGTQSAPDGTFSVEVPYGTYDLWVGGAVTENLTVSAAANTSVHNLTRFQVTGRLTDTSGAGVAGTVAYGHDPSGILVPAITAANALGVYTIQLFEGKNFICYEPPVDKPTLGSECITNVVVDESSVKELSRALSAD